MMKDIKILWFTNTPSLLNEKYSGKTVAGGWIPSLEKVFCAKGYNLRLAFHANVRDIEKDIYLDNIYYKIPSFKRNSKIVKHLRKCFNVIENENFLIEQYKQVINDFKPDIVQIWGSEGSFGVIIPYLEVPHILHFQGNLTAIYNKYFSAFSKNQLKWAANLKDILKCEQFFFSTKSFERRAERERRIFKTCKNFFGRTNFDRRIVKSLSNEGRYFHCNEIMRDEFYDSVWLPRKNDGTFKLISVFRDSIYKGLESIYDCSNLLKQKGFSFEWIVAGVAEDSFTKRLIKKNRNYSLKNVNVRLIGVQSASELKLLVQQSDLMVHTTHTENGCNSISEAMLMGIPVLATSAGGLQTTIDDDVTGFLVQDGDFYALAGAIMEIKENYKNAVETGQRGRETAQKRHNKEEIFNTVISTYEELINDFKRK